MRSGGGTTALESVAKSGSSSTVCGYRGVTVETAFTRGTPSVDPRWVRAKSMLDTIIAAAPSDVAQMSRRRSGSATIGLLSTSSTAFSLRNRALGFSRPCFEFFTFTCAKSSLVAP